MVWLLSALLCANIIDCRTKDTDDIEAILDSTSEIQDNKAKHREIIAWGQQIVLMTCLKIYLICESIRKSLCVDFEKLSKS